MKKFLLRAGLTLGTLGVIASGAAAFSAFEAHIINVTAKIENALAVDTTSIAFGTVFPQEYIANKLVEVKLSDSFLLDQTRLDDVEYVIKQKPKVKDWTCGTIPNEICPRPATLEQIYSQIPELDFTGPAWKYCEENLPVDAPHTVNLGDSYWKYCYFPLANSLSKHETTLDPDANNNPDNDTDVAAFHQAYEWDNAGTSSLVDANIAKGRLVRSTNDTVDSWLIDLKVPCFVNQCDQDADNIANVVDDTIPGFYVPEYARLDTDTEHQVFGTDLWIEVAGYSPAAL